MAMTEDEFRALIKEAYERRKPMRKFLKFSIKGECRMPWDFYNRPAPKELHGLAGNLAYYLYEAMGIQCPLEISEITLCEEGDLDYQRTLQEWKDWHREMMGEDWDE